MLNLRVATPFGGPVLPDVKMTNPGLLTSKTLLDEKITVERSKNFLVIQEVIVMGLYSLLVSGLLAILLVSSQYSSEQRVA
jgi:hypothetical protein